VCALREDGRVRKRRVDPPRLALSVEEAAASLGYGHEFFHREVAPELRWVRRGRTKRVAVTELQRWVDANADRLPAELVEGER
jgi:hypothetical protein